MLDIAIGCHHWTHTFIYYFASKWCAETVAIGATIQYVVGCCSHTRVVSMYLCVSVGTGCAHLSALMHVRGCCWYWCIVFHLLLYFVHSSAFLRTVQIAFKCSGIILIFEFCPTDIVRLPASQPDSALDSRLLFPLYEDSSSSHDKFFVFYNWWRTSHSFG